MNPVDEYFEFRSNTKTAAPQINWQGAQRLGLHGLFFAGGLGAHQAANKVYRAITKKRDFDRMMAFNLDFEERRNADPKSFDQYYNSLRSLNPTFAADPVVAGTYMTQMLESPISAGKVLVESLRNLPPSGLPLKDIETGMKLVSGLTMEPPEQPSPLDEARLRTEFLRQQNLQHG